MTAHVRCFVERHFVSGAHVEVLLLLRSLPDRAWTPAELGRALRIDTDQSAQILTRCAGSGFVRSLDGRYRYAPRNGAVAADIDGLARLYAGYRLAVLSVIFARPMAPIWDFSDVFNLRER